MGERVVVGPSVPHVDLQWQSRIERPILLFIVLCSRKKKNNNNKNWDNLDLDCFPCRHSLSSSPRSPRCLTTRPTRYLTQLPSISRLTRDRIRSSLTSPSSLHCPVQCPGYRETRPPKLRTPPLPLPFGYPSPSSTTSSVESSKLLP